MKLAILLTRRTHLKILSPVITAAVRRGHAVTLVADVRAAKRGDALDPREVAGLFPATRVTQGVLHPNGVDCIIGIESVLPDLKSTRLVGVDHFFDTWTRPATRGRNFTMAYHSEWHRDIHKELWPELAHRSEVVGWLPADQTIDMPFLAERERDSAVFFSLKMDVPEPKRQSRAGKQLYYELYHEVRHRARAEGLRFIVKSRKKNHDPWWMRWGADEIYYDDVMVPYTSLSLLARAKWCVHFESGAGLEAALMGCYAIAIAVPQTHLETIPGTQFQYGGTLMHAWPGVSQYDLPEGEVPAVEPKARRDYLGHFVGCCDGKAGERVLDLVEA